MPEQPDKVVIVITAVSIILGVFLSIWTQKPTKLNMFYIHMIYALVGVIALSSFFLLSSVFQGDLYRAVKGIMVCALVSILIIFAIYYRETFPRTFLVVSKTDGKVLAESPHARIFKRGDRYDVKDRDSKGIERLRIGGCATPIELVPYHKKVPDDINSGYSEYIFKKGELFLFAKRPPPEMQVP